MPEVGRQRKNQPWKGNVWCCGIDIPFSEYKIGKGTWEWTREGVEVKGQLQTDRNLLSAIKSFVGKEIHFSGEIEKLLER